MTSISRPAAHLATAALACLAVAACSGSGAASPSASPSASLTHSPAAPPSQPTSGPAAIAAITANWEKFFNGAIPIPSRLALLQNGQLFAAFIHSQEKTTLGSLVLAATAKVGSVKLQPPGRASVTYTILLSGRPLESNVTGTAIYTGGKWLIADSTFCGLIRLAYGKTSHLIPAACGS
jgi:hypothetical protein